MSFFTWTLPISCKTRYRQYLLSMEFIIGACFIKLSRWISSVMWVVIIRRFCKCWAVSLLCSSTKEQTREISKDLWLRCFLGLQELHVHCGEGFDDEICFLIIAQFNLRTDVRIERNNKIVFSVYCIPVSH
jgi:hypothetical protein